MANNHTVHIPGPKVGPEMYPMGKFSYGSKHIQKQYEEVLGPLTLFAPLSTEEGTARAEQFPEKEDIEEERPVTPIEESIKTPPSTFKQLAKLIRRRIAAKPDLEHLTIEEQQTLGGVIMGEVNCIWSEIRRQVDDPFLTHEENKELQRRITVHIVTVCEQLFHLYLEKAKVLNNRHVFSEQANISRLKAQLSLDCNKFLNILAVRRYIVADIRGSKSDSEDDMEQIITKDAFVPLSYQKLIERSRPKRKKKYKQTVEQEIRDMDRQMPNIQAQKALEYMPDVDMMQNSLLEMEIAEEELMERLKEEEEAREKAEVASLADSRMETHDSRQLSRKLSEGRRKYKPQRSGSLPELHVDTLLDEVGISKDTTSGRPGSAKAIKMYSVRHPLLDPDPLQDDEIHSVSEKDGKTCRSDEKSSLQKDLENLSMYTSMKKKRQDEPMAEEEDLPPLLQAVDETERPEARRAMLRRKMKEMEAERIKKEEREIIKIMKPTHPQPATVTTKLSDKSFVRTSDVRVSERISKGRVTLQLYKTVFNELNDDVDANTIKKLDSNLFRGQEINEVYNEIMKTLPSDHRHYDTDDFVEHPVRATGLQNIPLLASSNLTASRPGRVINKDLCMKDEAPWGEERDVWCKSPIFNASFAKQNPAKPVRPPSPNILNDYKFANMTASSTNFTLGGPAASSGVLDGEMGYGTHMMGQTLNDERNARTYASWLSWWKNTISSNDYVKFLATQETDYLGVVFHFFDHESESGADSSSEQDEENLAQLAREREKQKKLDELISQKTEFRPGMWNVGSVMLGGLGKDPEVEEEIDDNASTLTDPSPHNIRRSHSGRLRKVRTVVSSQSNISLLQLPGATTSGMLRNPSRSSMHNGLDIASTVMSSPDVRLPTSQDRLERIWTSLQMPDHMRLDMAIKYSSEEYSKRLEESLLAWEGAMELISDREAILTKLESFERYASDPDRFFQKGHRGLSVARLEEAKKRSVLYAALQRLEGRTRRKIQYVEKKFQDIVSYQGRPYLEKMKVDCTEMLYWLQQERRQQALNQSLMAVTPTQDIKMPVAQLPKIPSLSLLI